MDRYTLIVVSDDRSPVRRFQVPKSWVQRALYGVAAVVLLFSVAVWDYWRKTADNAELAGLRVESAEQREQIESFKRVLSQVEGELARVGELERKVRIIANLPGAAAVGGAEVTELVPGEGDGSGQEMLPAGVPVEMPEAHGQGGDEELDLPQAALPGLSPEEALELALTSPGARYLHGLGQVASGMGDKADARADSLTLLLDELEDKRVKLASMPSIWPARGWLTSRFGPRISPFTGRRQQHAGIDIASRMGAPIVAPARGRVTYVGRKGPLGNTLVVDHGFGVKTTYGHTDKIHVKPGQEVDRGQLIASIGNSGRSTGPHLHYVVEVGGKARNPLDYIFD